MYRNEVYGHIPNAQYDDATFERLWQDISKPLIKLLVIRSDIDELKVTPLSSEEESYVEKLKEWKELEDGLLEKNDDVERKINDMAKEFMKLRDTVATSNLSKVDQLAKFDFTGKIDGLCKRFQDSARKWFFDELSSWFTDEESGVMILTAGPGVGKSVLSAKVCELFKQCGQLAAYHFCDFRKSDYTKPSSILQSLASQMCDNVEGFRDKLIEILGHENSRNSLSDAFRVLLHDPLHALHRRKPMLIVVDALDESKTDDKSEFLELISDEFPELPKWMKILITSRPELQVKKKLEHFNPVEIHPDDYDHEQDLKHFFRGSLPNLSEDNIIALVRNCEGSFLYAYYLVKELKEMNFVDEANISDYAPKGISGFYEKQFKHLRAGLQGFKPNILKGFVNIVSASKAPLPIKILFECIYLSDEEYEIRNAISNIISEILPVYNDCLTVYHKSLTDWLTLDGYEEHAFAADIAEGTKCLWQACKRIYREIDFQKTVSDFELTREREYALENGGEYLVFVGDTEDFHWLVHVRLNALKLEFCDNFNVDFCRILRMYKTILTEQLYLSIVQHYYISKIFRSMSILESEYLTFRFVYLQSIANGYFDFLKKSIGCKSSARHVLDEAVEMWLEKVTNVNGSDYRIISNAVFSDKLRHIVSSPDNKLLVCLYLNLKVAVFELPSLTIIFELELKQAELSQKDYMHHSILTFSPDSSYFLCNSIRSCVCIRKRKEESFIPHGPANIESCSFSSCGLKLITVEKSLGGVYNSIVKVWDVKKKDVLVQVEMTSPVAVSYCCFSSCNAYIFGIRRYECYLFIWDSATLKELGIKRLCSDTCFTDKDKYQTFPREIPLKHTFIERCHFHLPSGEIICVIPASCCTKSFTWKNRKCVAFSIPSSTLVVYDFINQDVIDRFKIDCLPCGTRINCLSKLNATNFLVCLDSILVVILSFTTTEESSVADFVNSVVKCCTVSPDNLYIACCYENCILTIMSVNNGETLQNVVLQHPPEACWWSESYLWVVCRGVVVKYSYDSTNTTVLGNNLKECDINFHTVLKFAEGVLVVSLNKEREISIFKICNEKLCSQQCPKSIFASSVAISSDRCAVLLYRWAFSSYQLWEAGCENRWELHSAGKLDNLKTEVDSLYLTGLQNHRSSLWLIQDDNDDFFAGDFSLGRIDFSIGTPCLHSIASFWSFTAIKACYVPSNFVLIFLPKCLHVVNISKGATIAK
ncbi:E3 ubiquitin- ligase DZIP3, partial [Paramuricea clavata]